jgi:hypothetical protein
MARWGQPCIGSEHGKRPAPLRSCGGHATWASTHHDDLENCTARDRLARRDGRKLQPHGTCARNRAAYERRRSARELSVLCRARRRMRVGRQRLRSATRVRRVRATDDMWRRGRCKPLRLHADDLCRARSRVRRSARWLRRRPSVRRLLGCNLRRGRAQSLRQRAMPPDELRTARRRVWGAFGRMQRCPSLRWLPLSRHMRRRRRCSALRVHAGDLCRAWRRMRRRPRWLRWDARLRRLYGARHLQCKPLPLHADVVRAARGTLRLDSGRLRRSPDLRHLLTIRARQGAPRSGLGVHWHRTFELRRRGSGLHAGQLRAIRCALRDGA